MKNVKTASIAMIIGFVITLCLILAMLIKTSDDSKKNKYELEHISVLAEESSTEGDNFYIKGHFSREIGNHEILYLCPTNIEVCFKINGKVVYEFIKDENSILSTPGKDVAMLDLGTVKVTDTVEFELFAPGFSRYDGNLFDIFMESIIVGSGQSIYQYLIADKWIGIVVGLLMIFMGISYFAYALIYYRGNYSDARINIAFGFMSFSGGVYLFVQSIGNLLPLLLPNSLWCSIIEVSFVYLSISSMIAYLYVSATRRVSRKIQFMLSMLVLINLVVILILEIFNLADMYAHKEFMELLLFVVLVISLLIGCYEMLGTDSFQTRRFFISIIPTFVTVFMNYGAEHLLEIDIHNIIYIGVLLTIVMLALGIASDARVAQRNLALMTKQVIAKKDELDRAMQFISESKKRNAKLELDKETAEAQTQMDAMTGLYNKASMERLVGNYLQNNYAENVALIFIDLDHFKSLNDTLGHMVGDDAIRDAAKKLKVSFRRYDLVSRFGGDEFCVFLRSINSEDLIAKLDTLVATLAGSYTNGTDTVNITGSVGCAYCTTEHVDYNVLMKLADDAVYAAKEGGRNRYVILTHK